MNDLLFARSQMAMSLAFHIVFAALGIGMPLLMGGQVTLILLGWGLAQYPNLVTPDVTITNAAAPDFTLRLLLMALGFGAILLLPSLAYLFYVFKRREHG